MQLHWGWAVLGALVVGVAVAWWVSKRDDGLPPLRSEVPVQPDGAARGAATAGAIYRWVDAHGTVNLSNSRPPAGSRYTIVRINPNQNIIPMRASANTSPSAGN